MMGAIGALRASSLSKMISQIFEHWDIALAIAGVVFSIWLLYFSTWRNVGTE